MMNWPPFRSILLSMTCCDMVSSYLLFFFILSFTIPSSSLPSPPESYLPNLGQEWWWEETVNQVYVCCILVSWSQSYFFFFFVCARSSFLPSKEWTCEKRKEWVCKEGKGKSLRMSLRQREKDEVSEKGGRGEESESGSSLTHSVRVFRPSASIHFSDENTTSQDLWFLIQTLKHFGVNSKKVHFLLLREPFPPTEHYLDYSSILSLSLSLSVSLIFKLSEWRGRE